MLAQWLATSLQRTSDGDNKEAMEFIYDFAVAKQMLESHFATDCWNYVEQVGQLAT